MRMEINEKLQQSRPGKKNSPFTEAEWAEARRIHSEKMKHG